MNSTWAQRLLIKVSVTLQTSTVACLSSVRIALHALNHKISLTQLVKLVIISAGVMEQIRL